MELFFYKSVIITHIIQNFKKISRAGKAKKDTSKGKQKDTEEEDDSLPDLGEEVQPLRGLKTELSFSCYFLNAFLSLN